MLQLTVNEKSKFTIERTEGATHINGIEATPDIRLQSNGLVSVLHNDKSYAAIVERVDTVKKEIDIRIDGQLYTTSVQEPIDLLLSNMGLDLKSMQKAEPVKAPMPGMVLKILVTPGQQIVKGEALIILEAMKMENVLKAVSDGTVKSIKATERIAVEKGAVLIELE